MEKKIPLTLKQEKISDKVSVCQEVPRATEMSEFSVPHWVTVFFVQTDKPEQCTQKAS